MTCERYLRRRAPAILLAVLPLWAVSSSHAADREAGRKKAEVCVSCHGAAGVSSNPAVPSIAGQPEKFITTQLVLFREGIRKDPIMSPMATGLSNTDINNMAEYLSGLPLPPASGAVDQNKATVGRRLTEQFNCVSCHGATLLGQMHVPRLAGQQRDYLLTQLRGFKAGKRFDMDGNMSAAVQGLSDADAQLLADYISSLK